MCHRIDLDAEKQLYDSRTSGESRIRVRDADGPSRGDPPSANLEHFFTRIRANHGPTLFRKKGGPASAVTPYFHSCVWLPC